MHRTELKHLSAAATAVALAAAATVHAVPGNWTNVGGGNWNTASNWSSDPTVPGTTAGDAVNLNADFTAGGKTINLDVNATVGSMIFGDSNTATNGIPALSSSNGSVLTFDNNGGGASWTFVGNTSTTSSVNVALADNLTFSSGNLFVPLTGTWSASTAGTKTISFGSTGEMRIGATIANGSGQVALTRTSGTLNLTGNNSFSGGVTSTASGTLTIGHANALGTGTLTVAQNLTTSGALTIANNVIVAGDLGSGGSGTLTINGTVTNSGGNRVWGRGGTTNFAGAIFLSEASATSRTFQVQSSGELAGVISDYNGVGGAAGNMQYGQTAARLWQVTQTDNTYTGSTTVSNVSGVLEVAKLANGGSTSSIGASSSAVGNLILAGTLRYVGIANAITDRLFRVDNAAAAIESSGLGTLELSNTGTPTANSTTRGITLGGTNTGDNIFRLKLTGSASAGVNRITKSGTGKWILTADHTYAGTTTVSGGTLLINGTHSNGDNVTVAANATLGGTGTIGLAAGKSVTLADNATLAPGASAGTLTIGTPTVNTALLLGDLSVLAFELNAANQTVGGGVNDLTVVNGNLTLDGVLNVSSGPLSTGTWRLFSYSGVLTNNTLNLGSINLGPNASATIDTSTGGQVNLVVTVPEPASLSLLALAAGGLLRRRRKN